MIIHKATLQFIAVILSASVVPPELVLVGRPLGMYRSDLLCLAQVFSTEGSILGSSRLPKVQSCLPG